MKIANFLNFKFLPLLMLPFLSYIHLLPLPTNHSTTPLQDDRSWSLLSGSDTSQRVEVPHDQVLKLDCLLNESATDVNVTWTKDGYFLNCTRRCAFANHRQQLLMSETSPLDDGNYSCEATIENNTLFKTFEVIIVYAVSAKPLLDSNSLGDHEVLLGSNFSLDCIVLNEDSKAGLQIQYFKSNFRKEECQPIPIDTTDTIQDCSKGYCGKDIFIKDVKKLDFFNIKKTDSGCYICIARNKFGASSASGFIDVVEKMYLTTKKESFWRSEIALSVLGIALLAIAIPWCYASLRFYGKFRQESERRKKRNTQIHIWTKKVIVEKSATSDEFIYPHVSFEKAKISKDIGIGSAGEFLFAPDPDWEIERSHLQLADVIGEGAFGRVLRAYIINPEADTLPSVVAVKMLKEGHTDEEVRDLVVEMEILKSIGRDLNVINLVGVCTKDDGPLLVVVEYAEYGNLKDYLVRHQPKLKDLDDGGYLVPTSPSLIFQDGENQIYLRDLIDMSMQVAEGMRFLSSKKLIHRDLAARNVLVCERKIYKIADFGLSRDATATEYYRKHTSGRLPLKWMAPEAVFDRKYTKQSDVWSYGVLVWEIMSLGENPYNNMNVEVFLDLLRSGKHLSKPFFSPEAAYDLMKSCWRYNPEERPDWASIVSATTKMLQTCDEGFDDFRRAYYLMEQISLPDTPPLTPTGLPSDGYITIIP